MAKFYAVKNGRVPGVYTSWDDCKAQITGYSGAVYKSFLSEIEAKAFINNTEHLPSNRLSESHSELDSDINFQAPAFDNDGCLAYVDGSYSKSKQVFSYGIQFLVVNNVYHYAKCDNTEYLVSMNNVAGEIVAAMRACELALEFGKKQIIIVHDYEGTAKWVQEVNPWKSNKQGTQEYQEFIKKIRKKLKITFVWTRGHIGVEGNEIADKLAKEAIEKEYFKEYSEKIV